MAGITLALIALSLSVSLAHCQYQPNWDSLDKRPLPKWYDEAKIGIFLHWGLFSVPSFGDEWFWNFWKSGEKSYVEFMKKNYRPDFTYADFGPEFTAEFFDPDWWAELFKSSGAKYVVLTSKHHEGFTLWPSKTSFNWNAMDVGPQQDLIGSLSSAIRNKTDIVFGVYHSLFEWYNPMYLRDKANNFQTRQFAIQKAISELHELVNEYRPEVIWSDGDWEAPDYYWNSTGFLAWLYNESPVKDTVVVNDRWGSGIPCHHGDFYTCSDRYNPGVLQKHKWENAMTVDKKSWGYRREAVLSDFLTIEELLTTLAETISCGGNLLINIGPTKEGRIIPIFEERLRQMGQWLAINGEAVYESKPWRAQNDTVTPGVWYTTKGGNVYALVPFWPAKSTLELGAPHLDIKTSQITVLGDTVQEFLPFRQGKMGWEVAFPPMSQIKSQWAWVLKMTNVK